MAMGGKVPGASSPRKKKAMGMKKLILAARKEKIMPTYASTASFDLTIDQICQEAYERCGLQIRSGNDLQTAKRSLNLMLAEWANRGINLMDS